MNNVDSTHRARAQVPVLAELRRFGPASQSAVAGLYAWVVTVGPLAWAPVSPKGTSLLAILTPLALGGAVVLESFRPRIALILSVWGAVVPSVIVWARAPDIPSAQFDPSRAVLGFLGWAAFAFVAAAPPIGAAHVDLLRSEHAPTFEPRGQRSRIQNIVVLAVAAVACGLLQWPRTDGTSMEREVFMRVIALAASVLVAARAGDIVSSASRKVTSSRMLAHVLPSIFWLFGYAVAGVILFVLLN